MPSRQLVFLSNSPWVTVCTPLSGDTTTPEMVRSYFGTHMTDWREAGTPPQHFKP
jgi:hypothetical protein